MSSFLPKNGYKTTHAKATHEFASKAIPTRLHTLKFPCPVVHIAMIRATPTQHDRRRPPATCADSRSRSHLMTRWDRPRPACKVRVTSLHRHFSKDCSQVPTCSKHPTIHQGLDAKNNKTVSSTATISCHSPQDLRPKTAHHGTRCQLQSLVPCLQSA